MEINKEKIKYYQYLLYIAVSASFGIKGVGQAAKIIKGKK